MKISASKLHLFELCAGVGALPTVVSPSTDDQAAGTGRHRFLERAAQVGRDVALAEIPADADYRETCEGIDLEEIPTGGRYEVSYAYDCATDTARELGQHLARNYEIEPSEISGTADLVIPGVDGGRWLLVDFKGEERVDAAAKNLQLGFFAVALARLHELDELEVAICYIGHGGSLFWDRATLSAWDLEAYAARLRALHARLEASRESMRAGLLPELTTGGHCERCPSFTLCPAMVGLVRELAATSPGDPTRELAVLTDVDAGRAWVRVELLEGLVGAMKKSLRARAEMRGLPLPNGAYLMPCETVRRTIVVEKALPVLRERFGEQAEASVERFLSSAIVSRLARQIAPGKGVKAVEKGLWDSLEAAGAVKTSRFTQLRERKAGAPTEAVEGDLS